MSSPKEEVIKSEPKSPKRSSKRGSKVVKEETSIPDEHIEQVEMDNLSPRVKKLRDANRKSSSPRGSRKSMRHSRSSFYDDNLPDENTTLGRIYRSLDLRKEYETATEQDLYIRILSARGIPAPSPGFDADLYWQLDMGTNLRHNTKTVFITAQSEDEWQVNAFWGEDVFVRRGSHDQLLLTLRSKALGYNASFGKLAISSLTDLTASIPSDGILVGWYPLQMSFKSSDKSRQYNLEVRLEIAALPSVRPKDDHSAFIGSPPKARTVSVLPNPDGVYPGSTIETLVIFHNSSDTDKVAKGDFQISVEGQQGAYVEGKLSKRIQKRKSILFTPDPEAYRIHFPGIIAVYNDGNLNIDLTRERQRSVSLLSKIKEPSDVEFQELGTYIWKVKLPIQGTSKVTHEDPEEPEIKPTTLPPTFKFGLINVWEPIKKGNEGKVSGEVRHLIRAGTPSNECLAEFKVLPFHTTAAPQDVLLKFKSPFDKEDTFALTGRFEGSQLEGPWTFEGELTADSKSTNIESVTLELRHCLSMTNAGDGVLDSPFQETFKEKNGDLYIAGRSDPLELKKTINKPLHGYTMMTSLWEVEFFLIPTVVFKNASGESKKKELDGVAVGIYPSSPNTPSQSEFDALSKVEVNEDMKLAIERVDSQGYIVIPNLFYNPETKTLVDVPHEPRANVYENETGKKVEIVSLFRENGTQPSTKTGDKVKKKANRKSKKL